MHSFEDLQLDGDLQGRRSVASTIYVETNEDAVALEAKRRRYLSSPLFECSEPGFWMQLNHHDDPAMAADMEDVSPHESSSAGASSTLDLELRVLTLLDARVGFAINALQDGEEVSIAVTESMYILRVANFHLREHHAHNEELKIVMDCLIHGLNQHFNPPRTIFASLRVTMHELWLHFQADLPGRGLRPSPTEDAGLDVDEPAPTEDASTVMNELDELNTIRQRTMRGLHQRLTDALDRGDFYAADHCDDQLTMLTLM